MNGKKKLFLIILTLLLAVVLMTTAFACANKTTEPEPDDDVDPTIKVLTPYEAMDKVYSALIKGGDSMESATGYGVYNVFTVYTQTILNYTVVYKANYAQNPADSEIYVSIFDNNAYLSRLTVYYDGRDLYADLGTEKYVISSFGSTMLFGTFYQACRQTDMTGKFYDENYVADIFNRNNNGVNLGIVLDQSSVGYNKAGERGEVVEFKDLNLTIINDTLSFTMDNMFRGIDDKFDVITNKYLGFNLSRLLETRFSYIYADGIEMDISDDTVTDSHWTVSGSLRDKSKYKIEADVGYNDGSVPLEEGASYVKSKYTEANLGKNDFIGTIEIPKVSDEPFNMEITTDINVKDNSLNLANVLIRNATGSDFISAYYKSGTVYLDATGFHEWLDGAVDLTAFNLPKAYLDNIDLSRLISAGYNNIAKALLLLVNEGFNPGEGQDELYDKIIENFYSEDNTVYYKITEELIQNIRNDDESVMAIVARLIGIEEKQLASYIGEDFFSSAELIIGYNLDSGEVTLEMKQSGERLFIARLNRREFSSVFIPADCNKESAAYAPIKYPEEVTLDVDARLNVRGGIAVTDAGKIFGVFAGDPTGDNTPYLIGNGETLRIKGSVTQNVTNDLERNFVNVNVYRIANGAETLMMNVCTNPFDKEEMLVSYYSRIGDYENGTGLFYRISRETVRVSFEKVLGEGNIFDESNVLSILSTVMNLEGISQISKTSGWFEFSLIPDGDKDPVYELIGVKDAIASVKTRARFDGDNDDVNVSKFDKPVITPLDSVTIESLYSEGSAWKDEVEVCINSTIFRMKPPYEEESIKPVTGKDKYYPTAELFGQKITYEVAISSPEGTYKIADLADRVIVIDPAFTKELPDKIRIRYDNNVIGYLPCRIEGFDVGNVTIAGYNLAGFADDFDRCSPSKVIIGVDSIMQTEYEIYILVNNRNVVAYKNQSGNEIYAPGNVPVIGSIIIDPYTYAMKKADDPSYDPIADGIAKQDMKLRFNNVYGEETIIEGETEVTKDLTYDTEGVNYFFVKELGMEWDYDLDSISYMGSASYAYAYYGSEEGTLIKIAVQVLVSAQKVDYVKIDEEDNGVYTIDFLSIDTYAIPSQSGIRHDVYLYFVTDDNSVKRRKLVVSRPEGISDADYYENYVYGSLKWNGAEQITKNPEVVAVNGTNNLFGFIDGRRGNYTFAEFGDGLTVGTQTVGLNINVPTRYQSQGNERQMTVANSCTVDENGMAIYGDKAQVYMSPAKFTASDELFSPFLINPYDAAARLPSTVFLAVAKNYDREERPLFDSNGNSNGNVVIKEYNVSWVTTDSNGKELNLIEQKEDGGYGIKNPVVTEQDFIVYGKIGDRGVEKEGNPGYIWVKMPVRNLASALKNVRFDGVALPDVEISVDPYGEYELPRNFEAELESGTRISVDNVSWYVSRGGEDEWYPIMKEAGYDSRFYDADGKYIFSYEGGAFELRYTLEGNGNVIKQEIKIPVNVPERRIVATVDGKSFIDVYDNGDFGYGYKNVNAYEADGNRLFERLSETLRRGRISVAFEKAKEPNGDYKVYSLPVSWLRATKGEVGYENSIDRLLDMFVGEQEGRSMTLYGTIGTGTVNEQTVAVDFSFVRLILKAIGFERIYLALEDGAIAIDELDGTIDFTAIEGAINIRINKAFGLKDGDGKFASPYQYINYLFGEITLYFENGTVLTAVPTIDFGAYAGLEDGFNRKVLVGAGEEITAETTFTAIRLAKLSEGSVAQEIALNIHTVKDERIDSSSEIVAELFNASSEELYGDNYALPNRITVKYRLSGNVTYQVDEWNVGSLTMPYLDNKEKATGIPVRLINTLRRNNDYLGKQPTSYYFYYRLPCEDADYNITVQIPRKDLGGVYYCATDETGLYEIKDGVLEITNPYLYYSADSKYGLDVTKIPTVLTADIREGAYYDTDVNEHYVSWQFIEGVFTPASFNTGIDRVLFATADLPAYYGADGEKQKQVVELYLTVKALTYYGISYGEMPVVAGASGEKNVIVIDPYNDVMGYKGTFVLPTIGLTVLFNGGADSFVFGKEGEEVVYKLFDDNNNVVVDDITTVPYDEKGHSLQYDGVKDMRVLKLRAYLPGYADGIPLYLDIQSRIIETVLIGNGVYDADGEYTGEAELENVFFIDPYNTATFVLPSDIRVKFAENADFDIQRVSGWEIYDEGSANWISLNDSADFYSRADASGEAEYGFYKVAKESYKGKNHRLRGYISLGRTSTGIAGRQDFEIDVIILNRSLKEEYATRYRYDDPLGGLLSDIPGSLTEDMFVDYDRYYAELALPEGYKYSQWNNAVLPYVNWSIENAETVVDYRGGFDKDINGNLYFGNMNTKVLLKVLGEEISAKYEELVKSRMWDGYFTSSGAPQSYSAQTTARLKELKAEFDKEVLYATYIKTLRYYNAGTEEERQTANFMTSTLVNEISAEYGYNKVTEMNEIVGKMFERVKKAFDNGDEGKESDIYSRWNGIREAFVAEDSETNPELSEYRLLKVAKYEILNDKARPVFTVEEQNGYNARLRARIEAGLRMYVSATTWDALYDRVTNAERGVMDSLIKGSDELSKATALTNYRNYVSVKLGSIGERATANITAPALSVGNIIERYDESGNPVYKTEFIFNVYSSISFVEDVDVETAYNYYPLLKEYIDEGVRLAMEDVRSANKGVALENYVAQKTAGYVNSIVPVRILVDEGGREEKVIDFEYVYGNFNENATIYKEHWENLYTYKQEKAVEHIAKLNGSTDEEKWNNAYKAHQINKETDVCAQMDEIKARQAELGSGYNYTQMLSEYAEALKRNATAEMDGYYAQAVIDANVIMTDYIMEGNTKVASITSAYGGSTGTFEEIFGSVAEKAYDKLKESYAVTDDKQAEITSAFNNENGGNGASKARTVYYLMKNNTVSSELRERTENIFYTYLGGANAYGTFMNNLSSIGLTEEYVTRLVEVATLENGAFERSRFNGAFTDEEYEDYKNYVLVRNVRDYFKSIGSDYGNTVGGWLNYAVREKYSAGFGALCESNSAYIDLREELCYVKRRAFVRYVRAYEAKGTVISDTIEEKKTSYYEKNEFMNSEYIVNRLLSSQTFGYKSYLTPSAENVAALRSEALTMYRDAYADAKGKNAIDYAVYLYGDEAYAKLILRSDLGAEFINGLNNAYYRVLMDRMLDGINDKLISDGVSESEKQTTAYKTVEDGVRKTFTAVALANGKTFGLVQSAKISDIAEKTYLNNKYRNEIREYTDALLSLRTTYKNVAEIKTYDDVYQTDGETFDKINEAICVSSESLYTKSYDYINELLLKNEAYAYYYSVEKVVEEESGVEVYKQLGAYGLSSNSSAAETFVVAVKAAYIAATENLSSEGKALLANIIDDSVFDFGTEDSYFARAEALLNVYDILEANSDTEIAEAREILLNAILSNAVLPENGETEKAISEGIKLSVGQAIYKTAGITLDKIKVRSYLSFLAVLNALSEGRKDFGTEYLTEENISGDYSVTETAYKRKYVNLLCEVLKNGAYGVSLNVAYETVTGAIAEKEAAIRRAIELNDSTYAEKLLAKLRLTAAHEELVAGEEELSANAYLTNKRAEVENLILKRFISLATGADDNARKENAINLMKTRVFTVTTSFRAEDRVENEADKRHVIAFDKTALEENSGVSVKAPVYVGNAYKISVGNPDTQYKIDSIDYRYIQVEIKYVDFTDTSDAENIASFKDKNYIVIDPLAPVLPETVHAYGEYTATGSTDKVIYDIGYVTVDYGETFLYNIYDGQDKEVLSYSIDFIDVRGNRYTLPVGAEYLDRTVNRIYLETDIYGGTKVTNVYDEFNGYIDMFDEGSGKNLFTVNPILESMLDVNEKKYILPDVVSVRFADGTVQRLTEVEWDLSSVTYSLVGQTGINLRMNGYMCASDDGTVRNVAFDYGKQTITISLRDENGATISSQTYNNVPDENIWNMVLNVTDQTAVKVAVEKSDGTSVVLGEKTASGNYIDVPMEKYSLNPFDIVFPDNYTVTFKDGTETPVITDGGWRLEPGANGSYKMKDIIMGVAGDHNVMTEFNYLGYTIRVRFVADDIELEGLGEGEYYDGGVLYLVKGGGSVFEQLEDNYSYFYYNFSDVATKPDYRRVPLSFIDANISGISTENENVTTGVKGVLGWDKKAYPGGMTMSPNILFTIAVIDPMLYAKLGGETNPYVINDYISAPYDGNFQKKNDANEPAISEYFIKKYASGEELKFRINNDTVKYSVLQNEVHFECEFDMTGAFTRLCADSNGGKTVSFAVTLPLKGYLYTEVSGVEFDKTPVKNAKGEDLWKWNPVDEDSAEYRDGIVWELGKELKASYLPQATTAIGKNISLLWDLDGVNVNCSTVDTARGYYIVRGYYYDAEGKWDYKELAIFIDKFDASEKITEELGGSVNIYSEYNGRYYKLPIDPESEGMKMLRPDGSYASLSADSITIEYKGFGEDDRKYSTTNYPLDSGDYAVRVRIDDGNVTVSGELVFKLTIRPVVINPNNVTFVGESGNTVIYTYDGKGKELYVSGGLPTVKVDNWFASLEEKERLVNEQIAEGYGEITAKSRAYNKLYNRVTPATRRYLDDMKMSLEEETGLTNENLNAALFDRLMPNLEISEVIADVKYMDGNSVMKNAPIDVGIYTVTFTVAAADNTGNYYFNKNTVLSRVIEIVRPSVSYGIIDAEMEYNGKFQNPRISGLHDEKGNLPAGVTVTYRYVTGVGSAAQYFTDGIKNVGVYTCEVEIDGGNNYPSGSLTNQQVRISAKELLIEIDGAESAYLDSVADVSKKVRFNGLVGNDSAEVFGIADVYTEAKSYFVPGVYGIFLNGFYIRAGAEELYSTMDLTDSVERGGKTYYRLYLKPASEDGSLYRYVTDAGEYVYAEIIDMIGTKEVPGNYSVYVAERGDYTVYVDVEGEETVYTVSGDEELRTALESIRDGQKVRIYLAAKDMAKTVYSGVDINVNAGVSIIGCYDEDKNILTYVEYIRISKGSVNLRILAFEAKEEGDVSLTVRKGAGAINVYDCTFDGRDVIRTTAIETENGYGAKIMTDHSSFTGYRTGILAYGGNMEIVSCTFVGNMTGAQILSDGSDIQVRACDFIGNGTGISVENRSANVLNNSFSSNRVAINAPGGDEVNLRVQNDFDGTDNEEVVV